MNRPNVLFSPPIEIEEGYGVCGCGDVYPENELVTMRDGYSICWECIAIENDNNS